ncbi:hypothetical protein Nepgr_032494 [Nepenthes gracilis]|uniref:Uncharacterized protein n=1 Tax=Nepenthes gracilis TaxID=150966 RepID=A0AAD3TKD2_NEPGR|nr:hypothetical protein Nepgr_032494 [Nepenthes gracilis]
METKNKAKNTREMTGVLGGAISTGPQAQKDTPQRRRDVSEEGPWGGGSPTSGRGNAGILRPRHPLTAKKVKDLPKKNIKKIYHLMRPNLVQDSSSKAQEASSTP